MALELVPSVGRVPLFGLVSSLSQAVLARRTLAAFLILHMSALSIIALATQPTLPLDVVEQLAWARDLQWVYFKHPPLPAFVLWLAMETSGHALWLAALLGPAVVTLTAWLVWLLAIRIVDPVRALLAVLALEGIAYFNFTALEFNHNVIQMPIWALLCLLGHCVYREGRLRDWLALGAAASLGMLGKYSTVLMLVSLLVAFAADKQARRKFRTYGPWLSILMATVLLLPHLVALAHADFTPFDFPFQRAAPPDTIWDHIFHPLQFLRAQLADAAAALLLLGLALTAKGRDVVVAPKRVLPSDLNYVRIVAGGPLVLALALQFVSGLRFLDMWGTPMLNFASLAFVVESAHRSVTKGALRRFAPAWGAVFALAMVARAEFDLAAPFVTGIGGRIQFSAAAMTSEISGTWQKETGARPLDVVVGDAWYGGLVTVYAQDHPSLMIDGDWRKSPWISAARIRRSGAVLVWPTDHGKGEPANMAAEFPQAIPQKPLVLPYLTKAKVAPARIGWAIVPPAPSLSSLGAPSFARNFPLFARNLKKSLAVSKKRAEAARKLADAEARWLRVQEEHEKTDGKRRAETAGRQSASIAELSSMAIAR